MRTTILLAALLGAAASGAAMIGAAQAQSDAASRWTGFYAGGDLGGASGSSMTAGGAPCHVGCGSGGASYDGHVGYGQELGSGVVGGVEGDVGRTTR